MHITKSYRISVSFRLEDAKIVVIRKASSGECVLRCNSSGKESV